MGLRITAAVALAALTIALVLAWVATHHSPVGNPVPATDKNVAAYRTLVDFDYSTMSKTSSTSASKSCNTISDTSCADAIAQVVPSLQKWVNDLQAFHTPGRYKTLDTLLKAHLSQAVSDLNFLIRFQKANDDAGFDLAMNAAIYERGWLDPATFAIEGTWFHLASSYNDAVHQVVQATSNCMGGTPAPLDTGCSQVSGQTCQLSQAHACELSVQEASTQVEGFVVALAEFPTPARVSANADQLEADLAQADTTLLGITESLLNRDSRRMLDGVNAFTAAINAANRDAGSAIP